MVNCPAILGRMSFSSFLSSIPAALIALDNLSRSVLRFLDWAKYFNLI